MKRWNYRRFSEMVLLLCPFLLTSCAQSRNPLSDPDHSKPDARLYGQWEFRDAKPGEVAYLFVGRVNNQIEDAPAGMMFAELLGLDRDQKLSTTGAAFFVTSIGKDNYLSLFLPEQLKTRLPPRWKLADLNAFELWKYAVSDNHLTVWAMDYDAAAREVKNGQLKGQFTKATIGPGNLTLSNSTAELVRFLKNGGDKILFPDEQSMEFTRAKSG
jgi:hypothetical protein